jgi:hypothetical protein
MNNITKGHLDIIYNKEFYARVDQNGAHIFELQKQAYDFDLNLLM